MKIRSIAQYSHKSTLKKAISWCTKKDVILSSPLKPGARRALIKIWPGDSKKSAISGPTPPPQKRQILKKGGFMAQNLPKTARTPPPKDRFTKNRGGVPIGGGVPRRIKKSCQGSPLCFDLKCWFCRGGTHPKSCVSNKRAFFRPPLGPKRGDFAPQTQKWALGFSGFLGPRDNLKTRTHPPPVHANFLRSGLC